MQTRKEILVKKLSEKYDLKNVFRIRNEVFVVEQNCPPELEWEHEDESVHFVAIMDDKPIGTARWRKTDEGFKLERFAVLASYRGLGAARALIGAVLADLPVNDNKVYLNAQIQAVGLYQKFGFVKVGETFYEAGIEHYKMILERGI